MITGFMKFVGKTVLGIYGAILLAAMMSVIFLLFIFEIVQSVLT